LLAPSSDCRPCVDRDLLDALASLAARCSGIHPLISIYIGTRLWLMNTWPSRALRALFCAAVLFVPNVFKPGVAHRRRWGSGATGSPRSRRQRCLTAPGTLCLAPTAFWATFHYFWSARSPGRGQERATGLKVAAAP